MTDYQTVMMDIERADCAGLEPGPVHSDEWQDSMDSSDCVGFTDAADCPEDYDMRLRSRKSLPSEKQQAHESAEDLASWRESFDFDELRTKLRADAEAIQAINAWAEFDEMLGDLFGGEDPDVQTALMFSIVQFLAQLDPTTTDYQAIQSAKWRIFEQLEDDDDAKDAFLSFIFSLKIIHG